MDKFQIPASYIIRERIFNDYPHKNTSNIHYKTMKQSPLSSLNGMLIIITMKLKQHIETIMFLKN